MIKKILGPPGTGKTTALLNNLVSSGVPWERMMFVSLTNAAISEARSRARAAGAGDESLRWFLTQHAINRRLLARPTGFLALNHLSDFAKRYRYKFSARVCKDDPSLAEEIGKDGTDDFLMKILDKSRNLLCDWSFLIEKRADLKPYRPAMALFADRYRKWKSDNGYFDFIDLIEDGIEKKVCPPVDIAAIDEFQDASPLMVKQILLWSRMIPEFLVAGDHNQAIYGFMGAAPHLFKEFPCDREFLLRQSHRVPEPMAKHALRIIRKNQGEENFGFDPSGREGRVIDVSSLASVACGIEKIGKEKSYMLLSRNHFFLEGAAEYLRQAGIPCGGSEEKMSAVKLLKRRPKMITRYEIEVLISDLFPSRKSKGDADGLWERGAKASIRKSIAEGFSPIPAQGLAGLGAAPKLTGALLAGDISVLKMSGREIRYYEKILSSWDGKLDLVKPLTIHAAKGREADVVILLTNITRRSHEEELWGDIQAERRVWYVAMTRAREMAILVKTNGNYMTKIL